MKATAPAIHARNPYPGLRPFEPEHSLYFFGRTQQTLDLLRRLDEGQFVAVLGLSGSGKSSLVRAGLIPALRRGALPSAGSRWRIAVMKPGTDPITRLAEALNEELGEERTRVDTLESSSFGLLQASRTGRLATENLLLVVDQFEEVFRYERALRFECAAHFVTLLLTALREQGTDWKIYVVFTMRSDYLGECARFRDLPEALNASQYLVPRMNREQLKEAIEGPAALTNTKIDPPLLYQLLTDAANNPDDLPILQHLLARMWQFRDAGDPCMITLDHYNQCNGWDGSLDQHAGQLLERLRSKGGAIMEWRTRRIFQRLTELGSQGRDSRRPTRLWELGAVATPDSATPAEELVRADQHVREIIDLFRGKTTTDSSAQSTFLNPLEGELMHDTEIDITHESLIRRWRTLNEWAKAEAESIVWYRRVVDRARFYFGPGQQKKDSLMRGLELTAALENRRAGGWTEAWALRDSSDEESNIRQRSDFYHVQDFLKLSQSHQRKQEERQRQFTWFAAVVASLFLALAIWAARGWQAADQSATAAADNLAKAEKSRQDAEDAFVALRQSTNETSGLRAAFEAERRRVLSPDASFPLLLALASLRSSPTPQGFETALRTWSLLPRTVSSLRHERSVNAVQFSRDGRWIATGSDDHTARVSESRSGKGISRLIHDGPVNAIAFSPDGQWVATASDDRTARVFETRTGKERFRVIHDGRVTDVAVSPDGQWVATASVDKTVRIVHSSTGIEFRRFKHGGSVHAVQFSPDSQWVATAAGEVIARLFEIRSATEFPLKHSAGVNAIAFSPNGEWLATASADRTIQIFEVRTRNLLYRFSTGNWINALAFSPDGERLAMASDAGITRVVAVRTDTEISRLTPNAPATDVEFSPDGQLLAIASEDGTARTFEADTGRELSRLQHDQAVRAVAFSPDGRWVATASFDATARLFEAGTRKDVSRFALDKVLDAGAFSRDGQLVAVASNQEVDRQGDLYILETRSGKPVSKFVAYVDTLALAFSPDGQRAAIGSSNGPRIVETRTGRRISSWTDPLNVRAIAFDASGQRLVTASDDKTVRILDARSGKEISRFPHDAAVDEVAFSHDGRWIATGSDRSIRIFEVGTRSEVRNFNVEASISSGILFSPDNKQIAVGFSDQSVRIIDIDKGHEIVRLPVGEFPLALHFTPDGRYLLTASGNGYTRDDGDVMHVWRFPIRLPDLIEDACSALTRNLSRQEWNQFFPPTSDKPTCPTLPVP